MDAENLRYLLAVARADRLSDAAARLRVDETTVSRRIGRLESELGERLFDRTRHGWRLTEPGRLLLPHAEAVESSVSQALEAVTSRTGELGGTARVLTPDGFGAYVLVPGLGPLLARRPALSLEIITATTHDLITARDFDLAVTLERPSQRSVAVQHLARYELRFYASRDYLAVRGAPSSLDEVTRRHDFVWYVDTLLDVQPLRFLGDLVPNATARLQTNNIAGHYSAARAGLGIVPLPTYVGAPDPELVEVLPEQLRAERSYWLVTPRDLTGLLRVRELSQAIRGIVAAHPHFAVQDRVSPAGACAPGPRGPA